MCGDREEARCQSGQGRERRARRGGEAEVDGEWPELGQKGTNSLVCQLSWEAGSAPHKRDQ